jgi:superfamily I DNA/RNA helicase
VRTLPSIRPTPEQLPLIQNTRPGVSVIRGAAGSGKTTTALLRLRQLAATWLARRQRIDSRNPVRILVITYNRTLRGYISALASEQLRGRSHLELTVSTFSKWATEILPTARLLNQAKRIGKLKSLCRGLPLPTEFLLDEVDYLSGRFLPRNSRRCIAGRFSNVPPGQVSVGQAPA